MRLSRRHRRRRLIAVGVALTVVSGVSPQLARAVSGSAGSVRGVNGQEQSGAEPPGPLVPVSQPPGGGQNDRPGGGDSSQPCMAAARPDLVAFVSDADNLTADDGNGHTDAFLNDGRGLTRISQDPPGARITDVVSGPCLSRPGDRAIIGVTVKHPGSDTPEPGVVVVDLPEGTAELLPPPDGGGPVGGVDLSPDGGKPAWEQGGKIYVFSPEEQPPGASGAETPGPLPVKDGGGQPAGGSSHPDLSDQGQCLVFDSASPNLVAGDANGTSDIFLATGLFTPEPGDDRIVRISRTPEGGDVDGPSTDPSVSADCSRIVFTSWGTNIVPGDTNGTSDIFLHDVATGVTTAVIQGTGPSVEGTISPDGGYVAGTSAAPDLVPGDTNGGNLDNATPTSFQVIDRQGRPTFSTSIVQTDGPRVRVAFPHTVDLKGQSAGSVDGGALIDHQVLSVDNPDGRSNTNPPATLAALRRGDNGEVLPSNGDLTDGPDLTSAEVLNDDHGTPGTPEDDAVVVRYCFDEAPDRIIAADGADGTTDVTTARFGLGGYNSAVRVGSERATVEPAGDGTPPPPCLRARFPAAVDVTRFTFATVASGAVVDQSGAANPKGSTGLRGHAVRPQAGDITGPNLRGVKVDFAANYATFTFDDIAGTGAEDAAAAGARFAFLDGQGILHSGASVAALDAKAETVTVAFSLAGDSLVNAVRFVALPDAVRNGGGEPNVEQATDGDVTGPELTAVARIAPAGEHGAPRFDFTFNTPVVNPDPALFGLYTRDGTRFPADSASREGPAVIRVEAAGLALVADTVVRALAGPRAVFEAPADPESLAGAPNSLGTKPVSGQPAVTPTNSISDGPDLVSVDFLPDLHMVDFIFDQAVRDPHLVLDPHMPDRPTDVFVVEVETGDILRASVDNNERQLTGSSASPQPSDGGRYVVFVFFDPSYRPFLDVWRRDLLRATTAPSAIDFGTITVGVPSEPDRVDLANRGFGILRVGRATLTGAEADDFRITNDACSGRRLKPRARCSLLVVFSPAAEGRRAGEVSIDVNAVGRNRRVTVEGQGLLPPPPVPPSVTISPDIGPPGMVALVQGQGFPPGTNLELRWAALGSDPAPLSQTVFVTADAAGTFGPTPFLAFPRDVTGPRMLDVVPVSAEPPPAFTAAAARSAPSASAAFLAVPGTVQPTLTRASSASLARALLLRRIQLVGRR